MDHKLPLLSIALMAALPAVAKAPAEFKSCDEGLIRPAVEQNAPKVEFRTNAALDALLMPPPTGTADDIITEPEGTKYENAIRADYSLYNYMGMPQTQTGEALISDFVVGDGYIWLKPISTYSIAKGYLELEKQQDGTYVGHTPQVFYDQDNYDGTHTLGWVVRFVLKSDETGYYYDAEENANGTLNTDVMFTYENGVLKQADQRVNENGLPLEMLAMVGPDGSWAIYGSGCISVKALPGDMKTVTVPEDKEEHDMVLGYKTMDYATGELKLNYEKYSYATSPSEPDAVYLNIPNQWISDRWIRGTVGADKSWTFEKQYLGTYLAANMHIWFTPSTFEIIQVEQYGTTSNAMKLTQCDAIVLKYDEEKKSYISSDNDIWEVNASPSSADYIIYSWANPSINSYPENVTTPQDPTITNITPISEYNNFGVMSFTIPNYDVDGNFLDTQKMFYRVFINQDGSEPFALTPEEYKSLTENMTDIPYEYTDATQITCYNQFHNLYFYRPEVNYWGIQSIYKDGDVEKKSNIVWHECTGVDKITSDAEGETIWYDLHGRRVANPDKGIFIKKTGNKVVKVVL